MAELAVTAEPVSPDRSASMARQVVLGVRAETQRLAELQVTAELAALAVLAIAELMAQLVSLPRPVRVVALAELADLAGL